MYRGSAVHKSNHSQRGMVPPQETPHTFGIFRDMGQLAAQLFQQPLAPHGRHRSSRNVLSSKDVKQWEAVTIQIKNGAR